MGLRILLAGLYHETHTFIDEITRADAVTTHRGEALLARRGDGSTIDGFLSVAAREGWQVVPALDIGAMPSGTLDHAVFEAFWNEFEVAARRALHDGLDGVWLGLHGAMVTTGSLDPEGELLERLRDLPGAGSLPVFGVFDLHATFTQRMARFADALVGYRKNPHTDAFEAAALSATLLGCALSLGRRPRIVARTYPIVWPPTGTGTDDLPMRALSEDARRIERDDPAIWSVSIVGGYAFADTPDTGVSVAIVTEGDEAHASRYLERLGAIAHELREAGVPQEWNIDAAIENALSAPRQGPVLIVEPADNIGGGSPGDCTTVLRAFLRHRLDRAAVVINDADAVAALAGVPLGTTLRLAFGGRHGPDPGPVEAEVTLRQRSDGRFTLEDRHSHLAAMRGIHIDMGPCATLEAGGATILLTSLKTPPFDLGQLRSQGIVPETCAFIGVKAAVAHRRAYQEIAAASYTVATPGACPSDLTTLPYRHLRRPVFPLDPPFRPPALSTR
ncbi:M81 family metallopeptidase [Elioraea rosea]|uniref:M81 family metallopeptidase n=1 Tax=Elioraea rosea TaxID=2492390 RepID=UPI0011830389|nr:M81 family metallopeptidase [Elioraea rosea]